MMPEDELQHLKKVAAARRKRESRERKKALQIQETLNAIPHNSESPIQPILSPITVAQSLYVVPYTFYHPLNNLHDILYT